MWNRSSQHGWLGGVKKERGTWNGKTVFSIIVFLLLLLSGCGGDSSREATIDGWTRAKPETLDSDLKAYFDRSEKARKALAKKLFGRLSEVMADRGPKAAIEVCNVEAQGMTRDIGEELEVRIGRTSFRLRNPENTPPDWAKKFNLVENRVQEQVVLKKNESRVAVFTPIYLAGKCMTCHGPEDEIPGGVKRELQERYPDDRATGFRSGDLRGWFWVEAPAETSL